MVRLPVVGYRYMPTSPFPMTRLAVAWLLWDRYGGDAPGWGVGVFWTLLVVYVLAHTLVFFHEDYYHPRLLP